MTHYYILVTAQCTVSQFQEIEAETEADAIEMAKEMSMCYYEDFEIHSNTIDITKTEINEEWEEE